ncbi:four helix bundle protein [Taibaiella soli]|uniref:Four helix bundle protein n=1 Tax=Taibaiella soli TaxID=1649169 RepID=A0A2W2BSU0_9BACT|nr:four helix bundle protein [Taibaiella soli]PZF70803.1 four helix bundle protein [Taibaiella soli]
MFLQLNHQNLEVYKSARALTVECYKLSNKFPAEERFNMIQQIRRASLSVVLNIAEGCSRKSEIERKRFFEISRGSLIEIDAALDTASELGYFDAKNCEVLGELMNKVFGMLSKMLRTQVGH